MAPEQFAAWRADLGWTKRHAARELGLSPESVRNYEFGDRRDGKPVAIPKHIGLACAWLSHEAKADSL